MTKYWHLNAGTINNRNHMIKNNRGYIGLGLTKEINTDTNNNKYYEYRLTQKNTTPHQFNLFLKRAAIGDIIVLYENGVGHIYRGIYTGNIIIPKIGSEIAPDWNITEIQKHIEVREWVKIEKQSTKTALRKTLVEIKESKFFSILDL